MTDSPQNGFRITIAHLVQADLLPLGSQLKYLKNGTERGIVQESDGQIGVSIGDSFVTTPFGFVKKVLEMQGKEPKKAVGRSWQCVYTEENVRLSVLKQKFLRKCVWSLGINEVAEGHSKVSVTPGTDIDDLAQKVKELDLGSNLNFVTESPGVVQGLKNQFFSLSDTRGDLMGTISCFCFCGGEKCLLTCLHVTESFPKCNMSSNLDSSEIRLEELEYKGKDEEADLCLISLQDKDFDISKDNLIIYCQSEDVSSDVSSDSFHPTESNLEYATRVFLYGATSNLLLNVGAVVHADGIDVSLGYESKEKSFTNVGVIRWYCPFEIALPASGDCGGVYFTHEEDGNLDFWGIHIGTKKNQSTTTAESSTFSSLTTTTTVTTEILSYFIPRYTIETFCSDNDVTQLYW
eukprot:TRINITY_DN568_c0_g2_i1.p1 TRINITY_DN568_c0_g2~~TRINITY_DN568_c0_g2_i1.p1  ORF type:complete len:406 (+),score=64.91 TRINITY_DN568_c0_g2_i1:87-1304(+)